MIVVMGKKSFHFIALAVGLALFPLVISLSWARPAQRSAARARPSFSKRAPLPAAQKKVAFAVKQTAANHGVDPELIAAVAKVESNFLAHARSPRGAQGVMQLMPETAQDYGVQDPYDPEDNTRGGIEHLRFLYLQCDRNLVHALAAYNAGMETVKRYGGVPPYPETQEFVRKVLIQYHRNLGRKNRGAKS